jgi:hypothetical protein
MLLAALALTLTACGGGGEEPVEPTPQEEAAAPPPADPNAEEEEPDKSPTEEQVYEPFPTDPEVVPAEILSRLEGGAEGDAQPMLMYFYDAEQSVTDQQDAAVNVIATDFPGLIDIMSYDVGKFVETAPDGSITLDEEALRESEGQSTERETAQQVALLMGEEWLDVRFNPYIVFTDSSGYITYRVRGPIDAKLLEAQTMRATAPPE